MRQSISLVLLAVCIAVFAANASHAQARDCADMVRAIYKRMMGEQAAPGSACRLRYVVRTTSRLKGQPVTTTASVELIATNSRLFLASDQMEVHQDVTTSVVVTPARRTIYISGSNLARFREMRGSSLVALRDSVLAMSDVVECTGSAGSADRRVTFRLRPALREKLKMESVTMQVNTLRQTIEKLVFLPTPNSTLAGVEIEFTSVEYNYPVDRFARPLLSQFLDGDGRPLPKYRGYSVHDARRR